MQSAKAWFRTLGTYLKVLGLVLSLGAWTPAAQAGSARFVAGQGWGSYAGAGVVWATSSLVYYTDQGPLSETVSHAQADAMVAAAAAVWSVPTSSISYTQGGTLAEDVRPSNVSFDGQQFNFPADVQAANESNIPVAVIYDQDGSLIDLLLGQGASEPDGCMQNAVLGDIDDIHQDDVTLDHAVLILNGRCAGSSPEQLTQMQYQLARAFGRVLGLSWSQTNDNVFTAQTTVTVNQVAYWPVMHPLDLICSSYSYQCMSHPFTLRPDDLNTLAQLYPVSQNAVPAGKQGTSDDALFLWGDLFFPTGQGMDWVNITARRDHGGISEDWQTVSAVTGGLYQQALATPLGGTAPSNFGSPNGGYEGYFQFRRVPLDGVSDVLFTTEAINPLYIGDAAIGPYLRLPSTPSGSPVAFVDWSALSDGDRPVGGYLTAPDAAYAANTGGDGTETAPSPMDPSGWQSGLLGSWGHTSWLSLPVAAGHRWTLEVTAVDETGAATLSKAQPVLGLWNSSDATGGAPTVGSQAASFNSFSLGMTQIAVDAAQADDSYRMAITDQYGAGRADFNYVARVLYAAAVTPSIVGTGGGQLTITGMGFRQGNQVLVNGVPAHVLSLTPTQILANAPTFAASGASLGEPVSIAVTDPETAGSATIPDAISYIAQPDLLRLISAPLGIETSVTAREAFAIRVLASDGLSAIPNTAVLLAVSQGAAQLEVCGGAASCTVLTDADGVVRTTVTGAAAGPVTLSATEVSGGATVQIVVMDTDPVRAVSFGESQHYVAAGASVSWSLALGAIQDGGGAAGAPVTWSVSTGLTQVQAESSTGRNGFADLTVGVAPMLPGATETVTGCAWIVACTTSQVHGVDASEWVLQVPANTVQQVPYSAPLSRVTLLVTDTAGHPLQGATVNLYQRVLGWEGPCTDTVRCPSAPVLKTLQSSLVSDQGGQITLTPLDINGIPQVVEIAASSGTFGFVTLTLVKTP